MIVEKSEEEVAKKKICKNLEDEAFEFFQKTKYFKKIQQERKRIKNDPDFQEELRIIKKQHPFQRSWMKRTKSP